MPTNKELERISPVPTPTDARPQSVTDVGIGIVLRGVPIIHQTNGAESRANYDILISRRPMHTVYGGYWELPGGKVEPGEGLDTCVERELSEEVGVSVVVIGTLPTVEHTYAHGRVRLHPRVCRLRADSPSPRNLGVAEHRWVSLGELGAYRFPEANEAIITALGRALEEGFGEMEGLGARGH